MKLLEKWLEHIEDVADDEELIFEIIQDDTSYRDAENVATGQEAVPEIRIKEEYHKRLI